MKFKRKKREQMKQRIIEFLKNEEGHIATIPMLARAIQASPPTAKSIVFELEVERKVSVVMLGGEYVVKLEELGEGV